MAYADIDQVKKENERELDERNERSKCGNFPFVKVIVALILFGAIIAFKMINVNTDQHIGKALLAAANYSKWKTLEEIVEQEQKGTKWAWMLDASSMSEMVFTLKETNDDFVIFVEEKSHNEMVYFQKTKYAVYNDERVITRIVKLGRVIDDEKINWYMHQTLGNEFGEPSQNYVWFDPKNESPESLHGKKFKYLERMDEFTMWTGVSTGFELKVMNNGTVVYNGNDADTICKLMPEDTVNHMLSDMINEFIVSLIEWSGRTGIQWHMQHDGKKIMFNSVNTWNFKIDEKAWFTMQQTGNPKNKIDIKVQINKKGEWRAETLQAFAHQGKETKPIDLSKLRQIWPCRAEFAWSKFVPQNVSKVQKWAVAHPRTEVSELPKKRGVDGSFSD